MVNLKWVEDRWKDFAEDMPESENPQVSDIIYKIRELAILFATHCMEKLQDEEEGK